MIESLSRFMVQTGAAWVLYLLFALSVCSVAIALERAWLFQRASVDVGMLVRELRKLLRRGELRRAAQLLEGEGTAQRVVTAGLAEVDAGAEAAEEAMAASLGLERTRLERRLLFLGTVGNNAPFVGLLGTVIGVIGAFEALGHAGAAGASSALAPERVMSTIGEALVATAVGLIVAIPAVAAFNYFQAQLTAALADAETLGHVLLAYLRDDNRARTSDSGEHAAAE